MDAKQQLARYLLQIKAFNFSTDKLYTWASGIKSPIYTDNRRLVSFPLLRNFIIQAFLNKIETQFPYIQYIAAVATGAITYGAIVADRLNLPFIYVRPKPKSHGMQNQVEGYLLTNAKVIVIEDLISTGGSSLNAVEALRAQGAQVEDLLAVFTYNLPISKENFKKANVNLHTLTDIEAVLEQAKILNILDQNQINQILNWRQTLKI